MGKRESLVSYHLTVINCHLVLREARFLISRRLMIRDLGPSEIAIDNCQMITDQ
jgi:hypothetical protein